MLILGAEDVRRLLPMCDCIEAMDRAMRAVSAGHAQTPDRIVATLPDDRGYFFAMPGSCEQPAAFGAKLVSLLPGNPARGRPTVQGFVTLFDAETGAPAALLDGAEITRIRTAAASALAARVLARPDASTHGILGAGVLAAAHLEAMTCVRSIERVKIWARDPAKAQAFAARHATGTDVAIEAVADPAVAAACDLVSVVTNASAPVLRGDCLQAGAHLSLVGAHEPASREADSEALARARIYVDSMAGALREAGDLLIPLAEGRIERNHILGEIGQVLTGRVPGRLADTDITLYKSLGLFAQDLFAAAAALAAARERGIGQRVEFP